MQIATDIVVVVYLGVLLPCLLLMILGTLGGIREHLERIEELGANLARARAAEISLFTGSNTEEVSK